MIKCPNCGTMNEAGSRFCFQCGQSLAADAGGGTSQPTEPIDPPSLPRSPQFPGSYGPGGQAPSPSQPPPPPVAGYPPQVGGYPQGNYGQGGGFPPPGYPVGTPPGYMMPPEAPRRRRWLWITLGIIFGCILICGAFGVWGATAGGDRIDRWGTQLSEFSTEEAGS